MMQMNLYQHSLLSTVVSGGGAGLQLQKNHGQHILHEFKVLSCVCLCDSNEIVIFLNLWTQYLLKQRGKPCRSLCR